MFDRKKDEDADAGTAAQGRNDTTAPVPLRSESPEASVDLTPPPRATVTLPENPRRLPELPHAPGGRQNQTRGADQKKLIIGRDIVFNGKISSLDRLVVEGQVEATLKDCREIEIAETGTFKGHVEFERGGQVIGDVQAMDDVEAVVESAAAGRKKARNTKGKGRAAK